MSKLVEVNEATFEAEVLRSEVPIAVQFFGSYCAPCRLLSPLLESLALDMRGQAKIVAVDVTASPKLVQDHGVSAVPTILVFRNGILTHRMIGLGALPNLREALAA